MLNIFYDVHATSVTLPWMWTAGIQARDVIIYWWLDGFTLTLSHVSFFIHSRKWFNMWGKCTVLEMTAMAWTDDNYLSTTIHTLYNQSVYITLIYTIYLSTNMLHGYVYLYLWYNILVYVYIYIYIWFNIHVISGCLGCVRRWWENYPSWWSPVVHWHKMMAVARLESGIAVVSCESMPLVKEMWIDGWPRFGLIFLKAWSIIQGLALKFEVLWGFGAGTLASHDCIPNRMLHKMTEVEEIGQIPWIPQRLSMIEISQIRLTFGSVNGHVPDTGTSLSVLSCDLVEDGRGL